MIATLLFPILPPLVVSFLLVGLWGPGPRAFRSHLLLKICFAIGLALGLSSCMYFLYLLIGGPSRGGLIIGELGASAAAMVLLYPLLRMRCSDNGQDVFFEPRQYLNSRWMVTALSVCLGVALTTALTRFVFLSLAAPHGEIDALTIWNVRARFLARGDEQWLDSFISLLATHHPDYPLLLPTVIARWWTYLGDDPPVVQALVASLFTFATIGLAASSISLLKSRGQGILTGIVLLGTPFLIRHGASQYADVPLGFFILATLAAFSLHDREVGNQGGLLAMAGLMAGFASWTKNEGLLFVLVIIIARVFVRVPARGWSVLWREMRMFAVGLFPVLLIVFMFKTQIAPGLSPIVAVQGATTIEPLTDFSRYVEAGQALFNKAVRFGHPGFVVLAIYLLLMGYRVNEEGRSSVLTAGATLSLMLAGYFMVLIVTPHGVRYQVDTSLDRLWIQLWPSAVFLFFLLARTPEEVMGRTGFLPEERSAMSEARIHP